jgi:hypothetical protein
MLENEMARMTKAEREAHDAMMQAMRDAQQAEHYPSRLMRAMETATNVENFELLVRDGKFLLRDRDTDYDDIFTMAPTYSSQDDWDALESLEWALDHKAEHRKEVERKIALRRSALAKLTVEERDALEL